MNKIPPTPVRVYWLLLSFLAKNFILFNSIPLLNTLTVSFWFSILEFFPFLFFFLVHGFHPDLFQSLLEFCSLYPEVFPKKEEERVVVYGLLDTSYLDDGVSCAYWRLWYFGVL